MTRPTFTLTVPPPLTFWQKCLARPVVIGVALLGLGFAMLGFATQLVGCEPSKAKGPNDLRIFEADHTNFSPPTSVPSVTPSVGVATTQATDLNTQVQELDPKIAGLTKENLDTEKPPVLSAFRRIAQSVGRMLGLLSTAQSKAEANDAAVAQLTSEVTAARALVTKREGELTDEKKLHAKDVAESRTALAAKDSVIRDLKADVANAGRSLANWIFGFAVGIGILAMIGGGLILWLSPAKKQAGIIVIGVGGLSVALGMAGLWFGREIAIVGLVIGGIGIIGGIWAAIHYLRQHMDDNSGTWEAKCGEYKQAAIEIADGVQQAILAGKITLADVEAQFNQAQSPLARQIVDEATNRIPAQPIVPEPTKTRRVDVPKESQTL